MADSPSKKEKKKGNKKHRIGYLAHSGSVIFLFELLLQLGCLTSDFKISWCKRRDVFCTIFLFLISRNDFVNCIQKTESGII